MLIRARTKVSDTEGAFPSWAWSRRIAGARAGTTAVTEPWTVLVTGATTGLGLAITKALFNTPHRLILTGRGSSLSRFASEGISDSPRAWVRALDVTRASERRAVIEEAEDLWGGVDVLINNAGISYRSVVEHATQEEMAECLEVNFHGPLALTRLVLPSMRAKGRGRILNISSVGGMMAMPTMCLYSASKFALEGATESLWYEVRPWGIHVSLIQPGFIHSRSFERTRETRLGREAMRDPGDPYHAHYVSMAAFIARLMNRARATPEHIARVVLKTMLQRRPPLRVPATPDAHLFSLLRRFLPRTLYHALLYRNLPRIAAWGNPRSGELSGTHSHTKEK